MNQQILDMQAKGLEQMKSMQAQALELHERVADAIMGFMPELPELPGPLAELPSATEVMNNYFDYMTQVRDANVDFVQSMMAVWAPEEAAAPAKKTTAKKTSAKK